MTPKAHKIIQWILTPFAWLYGVVTEVRNWMFDKEILPSEKFKIPIIGVGNLTVGGTGKTPLVEFIVGSLASKYEIAVLSRGYKRKTKGFLLANPNSTPETIGDEPLQIYSKFSGRIKVAVCENRRHGIKQLLKQFPGLQLIVLDDAYQHRYVKPKVNILLMDWNRPIYEDKMLPLGRLRESAHQSMRADIVVVTKCPLNSTPLDYRLVSNSLELMPYQKLYFSRVRYGSLAPVFPHDKPYRVDLSSLTSKDSVMLVTGIANPRGFIRHFRKYPFRVTVNHFPDHHNFSRRDMEEMANAFHRMTGERKLIVTTEKDAMRLAYNPYFCHSLKPFTFYQPIEVEMIPGVGNNSFVEDLEKAVDKN